MIMKKILLLGSTGSIGINTLKVIRNFQGKFKIEALAINSRIDILEPQIEEFHPKYVVVKDEEAANRLKNKIGNKCKILAGKSGLVEIAAQLDYDIFIGAMVGFDGLAPTLEAVKRSKRIALANKETLVVAGELVTKLCKNFNSELIPIDSEHSAIYQCLIGESPESIEKLILTASGGPFRNKDKKLFEAITVEEALNHPNWKMGNKITIDSATLMNKGLEIIEAHWLFGIDSSKIEAVIHPQSIIHSMVQFIDGSVKAQLGLPDMKIPIQYALTYPDRLENNLDRIKFSNIGSLSFSEPDFEKFECLNLAYTAIKEGGTAPCILNAANEVAVDKFLNKKIKFTAIPALINRALEKIENHKSPSLETIYECDLQTRLFVSGLN